MNKNIPKYLQPFYKTIKEKGNYCVTGEISCCENDAFMVFYAGDLRKSKFGKKYFLSGKDSVVVTAECEKCLRDIHIFDDAVDGYNNCIDANDRKREKVILYPFECDKCHHNIYHIMVSYEYPESEDLEELDISNKENSFTWIKVSLECAECGRVYKNLIDFEMG